MKTKPLWLVAVFIVLCLVVSPAFADELLVSAAASLTDAMTQIGRAYTKANPKTTVRFNFAASGVLQRQIEEGAPVDVFASASPKEVDALEAKGLLAPHSRVDFVGNRLVLIVTPKSRIRRWEDLASPVVSRIALPNPASVPSGRYAKETLEHKKLWTAVQAKAVLAENVRQALTYVASGDVEAGIVFATDAKLEARRVRIAQEAVPGKDHSPILYTAAAIKAGPNGPESIRFVAFLQSPVAQGILNQYGFTRIPKKR